MIDFSQFAIPVTLEHTLIFDATSHAMTELSADQPKTDLKDDLFGHAPFAESLAKGILGYKASDALVLALHGPWGSGKTTILNFIKHYLEQQPEAERPIVVTFNPWWFSGQENLARAFLDQLQAAFPKVDDTFDTARNFLSKYAAVLGAGVSFFLLPVIPEGAKDAGELTTKLMKREPVDIPALKEQVCEALEKARQRILVIIDDIDRLTPEETRQLFTVIKALADFPNVIYLLAFDREVAARAIEQQCGLPGQRFLEKIIQVPFEIPLVERTQLRSELLDQLSQIMEIPREDLCKLKRWGNVFDNGVMPMFEVPRHVVRFINTVSFTYPSVRGEVNPVDFIAIEAIRVFLPTLYERIRLHPNHFIDFPAPEGQDEFHKEWKRVFPQSTQVRASKLIEHLFPVVSGCQVDLTNGKPEPKESPEWKKELRACHQDNFPRYFQFRAASQSDL